MKKQIMILGLAISLVLCLAPAGSASVSGRMKVNIPFDFVVGESQLPAGQYTIDSTIVRGILMISRIDGGKSLFTSFYGSETSRKPSRSKLVFRRYGDQYFLAQVWDEGTDEAKQLHQSRAERELKHLRHLAQNTVKPELITVLAQ